MGSVNFRIHYATRWGETLWVQRRRPGQTAAELSSMSYEQGGFWSASLPGLEPGSILEYRYEFHGDVGDVRREPVFRQLVVADGVQFVRDYWLAPELPDGTLLRQAFAGVIFNPLRTTVPPINAGEEKRVRITLRAPRVLAGHRICLSGNHHLLGNWDPLTARPMSGKRYPIWELDLPARDFREPLEFKFGIWDERQKKLVQFEAGPNRRFEGLAPGAELTVLNCEHFEHPKLWRGAGVAIPVFSLRTENGYGIGEFRDLAPFAKWAAQCKLHLVQLLPINDTSSDFTWQDSYPYKAISTAALHPVYISIDELYGFCGQKLPPLYSAQRRKLNALRQLDYEAVLNEKLAYLRKCFDGLDRAAIAGPDFQSFFAEESRWLRPYAAFCRLRDLHKTADFSRWNQDAGYRPHVVNAWFEPDAPEYHAVMFYCWVQLHLDRQLKQAVAAAHACGVAFKGDLPIGIDRCSVEAWTEPELFRMDRQTGAPPDAFAVLGQNWGFPTYNWSRMEKDGYAWWQRRFHRMAETFDALRIDHILGFFRIWEIPRQYREGILGHFNPTLPLTPEEIKRAGFTRDPVPYLVGAVPEASLAALFGLEMERSAKELLAEGNDRLFRLKPEFASAAARLVWYDRRTGQVDPTRLEDGFTRLGYEVLFLEDPDQPGRFHPRINLSDTMPFKAMLPYEQVALRELHDDFYHRRHTKFWAEEAMKKLPVLMDASQMLICGEDLGMVPEAVPMVLKRLGLLSLEVQRWPKIVGQLFGGPSDYPYLSVCTTSTHDMSTIRGWWEEEPDIRQRFWSEQMRREGPAPAVCGTYICRFILRQNLESASMWCILPLQDWLSIDSELRHPVAADERINIPAIPRHYWRYRMHLTVEQLLQAEPFNTSLAELVNATGRASAD